MTEPQTSSTRRSRSSSRQHGAGRWCSIRRTAAAIYPRGLPDRSPARPARRCAARRIPSSTTSIAGVVPRGYPLMRAHFPRCYVDVNREPYELDPRMFDGRLPSFANTRSMRVAGGLGTVARVVGDAQEIYDQRISVDDALRRIESLYKPYHRALRRLFTRVHRDFGAARADRLPLDAVGRPAPRTTGRAPTSCSATATARAASPVVAGNRSSRPLRALGLRGQPQQALCRRLHHRALRQSGRRAARDPDRDSTARSIWTSAATSASPRFAGSPPTSRRWPTGSPRIPLEELRPYRAAAE